MSELEFTGERLVPGVYGKIAVEHLHRYAICFDFVKGKKVLDIASGEGYGSNLLSKYAQEVVGVDISQDAVCHANNNYSSQNLCFKKGSVFEIPCEPEVFDVVVSFETIEHISDHNKMIAEIKRVLKSDGVLIISTPEKSNYSDQPNYYNPYHEKELYEEEFLQILNEEFQFIQMAYQKFLSGSFIQVSNSFNSQLKFFGGDFKEIKENNNLNQEYLIAICSDIKIEKPLITTFFNSETLEKKDMEHLISSRVKKFKSGLRYQIADILFKPWDIFKSVLR